MDRGLLWEGKLGRQSTSSAGCWGPRVRWAGHARDDAMVEGNAAASEWSGSVVPCAVQAAHSRTTSHHGACCPVSLPLLHQCSFECGLRSRGHYARKQSSPLSRIVPWIWWHSRYRRGAAYSCPPFGQSVHVAAAHSALRLFSLDRPRPPEPRFRS